MRWIGKKQQSSRRITLRRGVQVVRPNDVVVVTLPLDTPEEELGAIVSAIGRLGRKGVVLKIPL